MGITKPEIVIPDAATVAELNGTAKFLPRMLTAAGRPGAGKDTNANPVAEALGYGMIRTSALLKKHAEQFPDDEHTEAILKAMAVGGMAPDEPTAQAVTPQLVEKLQLGEKVFANGFPRTKIQYLIARGKLDAQGIDDDYCLFFDITEDLATQRILAGARGREDDKPEVIAKRMRVYNEETRPVIDAYGDAGRLITIAIDDPNEKPEQVQARVRAAIIGVAFERARVLGGGGDEGGRPIKAVPVGVPAGTVLRQEA